MLGQFVVEEGFNKGLIAQLVIGAYKGNFDNLHLCVIANISGQANSRNAGHEA